MGLSFGSKKKWSSQTDTTTNSSTTPILPDWTSNLVQGAAGKVGGLTSLDPTTLVAPADDLQLQARAGAADLSGSPWNFDGAADLTRGVANTSWVEPFMNAATPQATGGRASDYVSNYLNPYLREVVDTSTADFDRNAGNVRAQQALDLAGSGAFGGSGAALTQSMTEGELARARATTLSGLRSHAYETALQAAVGDADRATQTSMSNTQTTLQDRMQRAGFGFQAGQQALNAAKGLVDVSTARDDNMRANIGVQAGLGDTFRKIDTDFRQAPVTSAQQVVAALSGLPLDLFRGQQTSGTTSEKASGKSKDTPGLFDLWKASQEAAAHLPIQF
jgi:hypothetical protein